MKPTRRSLLILLPAILSLAFVTWVILNADKGTLPGFISTLYNFPNGDKVGHFFLMGLLSFVLVLALPQRFKKTGWITLILLLILEEISQLFVHTRTFSLLDLACSLAGAAVFGAVAFWLIKPLGKRPSEEK